MRAIHLRMDGICPRIYGESGGILTFEKGKGSASPAFWLGEAPGGACPAGEGGAD